MRENTKLKKFSLNSTAKKTFELNKLKNNLIIFIYPKDNTPGCTLESLDFKKKYSQFKKYKTFIAASTHETEELFAAKTHILLKKKNKNIITIIIPRHINRVKQIIAEIKKLGLNVVSRSSKKLKLKGIDIFIVDTFGETKKFYKFATTVFLGKSIIKGGGQNPLEPARFGAKILHGPDVNNFKDVYKYLRKLKISSVVNSPQKCADSIIFKKNMKKVQKMKYLGSTILKKTLNELDKSIHNEI